MWQTNPDSITQQSASDEATSQQETAVTSAPRVVAPKAQTADLTSLSPADSLKLNLSGERAFESDYFHRNTLSVYIAEGDLFQGSSLPRESNHAVAVVGDPLNSKGALRADDQSVFKTITQPQPKVIKRKVWFEGQTDWLMGLIMVLVVVAGYVKFTFSKYLDELFSGVRYQHNVQKLYASQNIQYQKPSFILGGLFYLSTALLIFEFIILFKTNGSAFDYAWALGGLIAFMGVKNLLYRFVGFVFDASKSTGEYLFTSSLLSKIYGLVIIPVVAVVPFVNQYAGSMLLRAGLVLFIVMYMIQLLRGMKIILASPLSMFYMFLYFCALEILPLSILIKVMIVK